MTALVPHAPWLAAYWASRWAHIAWHGRWHKHRKDVTA